MMKARVLGVRRPLQHERFSIEGILCEMVRRHWRAVRTTASATLSYFRPRVRSVAGRFSLRRQGVGAPAQGGLARPRLS
jgi:hypothetical protein